MNLIEPTRGKHWVGTIVRWSSDLNTFHRECVNQYTVLRLQQMCDWTQEDLIICDTYDIEVGGAALLSAYVSGTLYTVRPETPILKMHIRYLKPIRYITKEEALLHPYPLVKRLIDCPHSI